MGYRRVGLTLARAVATVALVLFLTPQSKAQTVDVSGRYQCAQAKVRGKVIPCKAAPLILKNDGRFELRGWVGSYLVNGEWVELSDSLIKARAKIEPGHKIVLRYYGKEHGAQCMAQRQDVRTVFQGRILRKIMPQRRGSSQALYQRNPLRCSSAISFARASVCARRYWPTEARMAFNKAIGAA